MVRVHYLRYLLIFGCQRVLLYAEAILQDLYLVLGLDIDSLLIMQRLCELTLVTLQLVVLCSKCSIVLLVSTDLFGKLCNLGAEVHVLLWLFAV